MSQLITIDRHILDQQSHFPQATGAFTGLMYDIALAAKLIASRTTRAGLTDILGQAGQVNVQGEMQQKLDVYADEVIHQIVGGNGRLCIMASEEHEQPLSIPPGGALGGEYVMLYDPLDGSSNIDYNVAIGTIFSIHHRLSPRNMPGQISDLLRPGSTQVAAGYVVYGSSTMLVYSAGEGVHGFTLDPQIGEFVLSHPSITFPARPRYYSINHGQETHWSAGVQRSVSWLTGRDPERPHSPLSLRYIGSLVGDFHRTLLSGGVFMYPAVPQPDGTLRGKLRLTYECAPLAYIAEQAGGYASDGFRAINDIQPEGLHQRVPFFAGSRDLVEQIEVFISEAG
ncbi:MAG: class 1 fructose-bisphosphatase [Anaerolineae bacterium]|nr:class 1 fructose-bisphosphatase [Anaerolineae bacterium]